MSSPFYRLALVLGLLSAVGPFAIDMYLPALPSIGKSLGTTTAGAQASLMAFFAALGVGQLVYGPLADLAGRKPALYAGLLVFGAASIGCALAPDIQTLVALRFVQGIGACAGMTVPRAVVRDLYTGHDATRMMSLLMLVFSVSPILAPLMGSFLIEALGWRSVFWAVTVVAALGLLLLATSLPETRPRQLQAQASVASALAGYRVLLRDRHFLGLALTCAFGVSSFFAYLANSSFVLIDHYGLTPRQYGLAFAANAASFIGVSQFTSRLGRRFGMVPLVRFAVAGYAGLMALLLVLQLLGVGQLWVLGLLLLVGYGFLGLVVPTTAVLAMEEHGEFAGAASGLLGTLQFVAGALTMAVVGPFADGSALPMVAGIAAYALLAWAFALGTLGRGSARAQGSA